MTELPKKAFRPVADGTLLSCRVQPGASRSGVVGGYGEEHVKIALSSPPVDGKANLALCRLLSDCCGVPKGAVEILSGQTGRSKIVKITGIAPDALRSLLSEELK
ncbi:MAG: YggU family protein [Lentisphaeria bacterium]|nr:YggU family protein [Lentisphaeria bacterium]